MNHKIRAGSILAAVLSISLLAACDSMPKMGGGSSNTSAKSTPAASGPKIGPGMNEKGEVVDPTQVEAGYGEKVKGLNDWEGEITGKPVSGSKFSQLKIGMSLGQVMGIVGEPNDQGAYLTGKSFIPFYFGSDRHRYETVYKGQGRLVFAGGAGFDMNSNLVWIIHSANEPGVR